MPKSEKPFDLFFNLSAILFLLILLGLGIAYYFVSIGERSLKNTSANSPFQMTHKIIAGQSLVIPNSLFRYADNKLQFVEKIDLQFLFPALQGTQSNKIDVIIQPLRKTTTSASLLDNVYLHQFLHMEIKIIKGLIGKPLKPIIGNKNESVFYDPISANPFVVKCIEPATPQRAQRCIRTVQISDGLVATYSFDFEVLQNWREFDEQANLWLSQIDGL